VTAIAAVVAQPPLHSDGPPGSQPPYVDAGGARIYLIVIRVLPRETASTLGKTKPVTVNCADLVAEDAEEGTDNPR
jgi:hypothetical protein